jgi:hypothetical protein
MAADANEDDATDEEYEKPQPDPQQRSTTTGTRHARH